MQDWIKAAALSATLGLTMAGASVHAETLVRVATTYGDFTVELFDQAAPNTVNNFLGYVDRGDFSQSVVHRSVKTGNDRFVVQAGAYRWLGNCDVALPQPGVNCAAQFIPQQPPVVNEPGISNTRGTLAMAKMEGDPNSATNQWFINLANNAENLDNQNGGFTVFGRVLGDGLSVADAINDLPVFQVGGEAQQIPLRDFSTAAPVTNNLVLMNMHRVSRYSAALHVFEFASGLLSTHVNTNQHGRMSLLLKLVENGDQVVFQIDPRSMIPLATSDEGVAQFNSADQRLRIPQVEVNEFGQVYTLNNLVFRLLDEQQLRFVLESWE